MISPKISRSNMDRIIAQAQREFPYECCGSLEAAVPAAARDAFASELKEPVVLLSPACASFDQFPDFEKRGDRFRELVKALLVNRKAG